MMIIVLAATESPRVARLKFSGSGIGDQATHLQRNPISNPALKVPGTMHDLHNELAILRRLEVHAKVLCHSLLTTAEWDRKQKSQ